MDGAPKGSSRLRIVMLSAASAVLAPLVFVLLIAGRKAERRLHFVFKSWHRRFERELARWT
jgi:hypothetical protein